MPAARRFPPVATAFLAGITLGLLGTAAARPSPGPLAPGTRLTLNYPTGEVAAGANGTGGRQAVRRTERLRVLPANARPGPGGWWVEVGGVRQAAVPDPE